MYVPNYIPEPLEVTGNITQKPYLERVRFIRTVVLLHSISLFVCAGLGLVPNGGMSSAGLAGLLVFLLIFLDVVRIRFRGKPIEAVISAGFLPVVLLVAGWAGAAMTAHGWPTWAFLFGASSVLLYTAAAGRDFSFVGCLFLALIVSSVSLAGAAIFFNIPTVTIAHALLLNLIYLCYAVYDLASLLARRRKNEAMAAVLDLYRDVFNFIGYFWRCIHHWRKHRIWVMPK